MIESRFGYLYLTKVKGSGRKVENKRQGGGEKEENREEERKETGTAGREGEVGGRTGNGAKGKKRVG